MKIKLLEDGEGASVGGTTSADIAPIEVKLGDSPLRRKRKDDDLEEGYVHPDVISQNLSISFYSNHSYDEELEQCFDVASLENAIRHAYTKRASNSNSLIGTELFDLNITEEDVTTDEIAYCLNLYCKHHHVWKFSGFAQHKIQVIFSTEDSDKTVVIHQHFPRR